MSSSDCAENADHSVVFDVAPHSANGAHIQGMEAYKAMYAKSIEDPEAFWAEQAREVLTWSRDFDITRVGTFGEGDLAWFVGGQINVSYNCIDRHIANGKGEDVAIIWEGDEPTDQKKFTYNQVLREVSKIANTMLARGVRKGDPVTIYMPMVPEIAFVMLACTRIGAPHSVVFAGFSADSLRDRIVDVKSKWVFATDEGKRGGRTLPLKKIVDDSLVGVDFVEHVFVFKRTGGDVPFTEGRDVWMEEDMAKVRPFCPAVPMDAEDTLFLLYTSGSTGKPKGVAHTTAGYLLYTTLTHRYVFDYRPGDVYACVADCGWITGHSYIVYGPMSNGATTLMFESTPLYPDAGRYWDMVQRHKVTQFYTAPTAIRALMRHGTDPVKKYDLSSLRILGTVGEPINPEAWKWYHEHVGGGRCAIVDTYWQTETGGIIMTPLPGCTPMKPGAATLPFFGIQPRLLDAKTGALIEGNGKSGVLAIAHPWPSLTRTVAGDHQRYLNTYMRPYPGHYFTGDGCTRDKDGYYWITGRVDDVLNVSGHRIGTAEIESALVAHGAVAEAACIGCPHEIKGEGICCYVITVAGVEETPELEKALKQQVRTVIGPFATPELVVITPGLPKTRSGKIMRRVLRKIASGEHEQLGDMSTLADPTVVEGLIVKVTAALAAKKCK